MWGVLIFSPCITDSQSQIFVERPKCSLSLSGFYSFSSRINKVRWQIYFVFWACDALEYFSCRDTWHSKKQHNVSLSTVDIEYVATASCCPQVLYLKQLLHLCKKMSIAKGWKNCTCLSLKFGWLLHHW